MLVPELTVVVPTFKLTQNVHLTLGALSRLLAGIDYEILFVDDDSPDGTAAAVRAVAQTDPGVRAIQRIRRLPGSDR